MALEQKLFESLCSDVPSYMEVLLMNKKIVYLVRKLNSLLLLARKLANIYVQFVLVGV